MKHFTVFFCAFLFGFILTPIGCFFAGMSVYEPNINQENTLIMAGAGLLCLIVAFGAGVKSIMKG